MLDLILYLAFIGAVLAMQVMPGPDMVLVMSRGIGEGRRVALWTVGMTAGAGLIQLPLPALGIAAIVQRSPLLFELLRWAGAAYLIWLGLRLLLRGSGLSVRAAATSMRRSGLAAMRDGMVST